MNVIPKMAEALGLKIGERFKLNVSGKISDAEFFFTEEELLYYLPGRVSIAYANGKDPFEGHASNQTIVSILNGEYEIVKLPWVPKIGEDYWCVLPSSDPDHPRTSLMSMNKSVFSMINLHLGNYYQTQEEAEADKNRFIKELKDRLTIEAVKMIFGKEAAKER